MEEAGATEDVGGWTELGQGAGQREVIDGVGRRPALDIHSRAGERERVLGSNKPREGKCTEGGIN